MKKAALRWIFGLSPLSFLLQSYNFLSILPLCNTETCSDSQLYRGGQQGNWHKLHHVHQKAAAKFSSVLDHLIACHKSSWPGITGNILQFRNLGNFYFQCVKWDFNLRGKKNWEKMSFFFFLVQLWFSFPDKSIMESFNIYNMTSVSLGKDLSDRQQHSVGFGRILQRDVTAKE